MHKQLILILFLQLISCNQGNLVILYDLPTIFDEVSGIQTVINSDLIWMLNDRGNPSKLYAVTENGTIKRELNIKAKNNDWEDLTSDNEGHIYIGDFGNNDNDRKNLAILKVNNQSLKSTKKVEIERISFKYSDQAEFPPKKKHWYFDCEAFFYYQDNFYLFTKSRVRKNFGQTSLYKIPATPGSHVAQYIATFHTGSKMESWITGAAISKDGKQVALLTSKSVWMFSNYKGTDFFSGTATELELDHNSQKEGICFKNENTLYITDEKGHGSNGYLYSFKFP
ncbi:hypothetical protein [Mariniflexile sp. AS56]|uniref:hypothetical protein n=1 Tax=Mariniflexile sp. AS56 TaxID=3063957 RepID=UPI0026EBC637|nr:hypothetical protein [Mariniflexile sp. AS56]MDO7170857.1 hypothetical protein [Mariniflexile sp. AS56]